MTQIKIAVNAAGQVQIKGKLTFDTVLLILRRGQRLCQKQQEVCFDLSTVEHCDSAGMALLLAWRNYCQQQNKTIKFLNLPPQLLSIAKVSELNHILEAK